MVPITPTSQATPITAPKAVAAPVTATAPPALTSAQAVASWSKGWKHALATQTPAEQAKLSAEAAETIHEIQCRFAAKDGVPRRAQHAKALYSTTAAGFKGAADLPPELAHGPFAPGGELRAIVRLSNVSGTVESDDAPDLRGIAIRLTDDQGHSQDLLMNTSERFMTKDAKGAIVGAAARGLGLGALVKGVLRGRIGPIAAVKMVIAGKKVQSKDLSLAASTFWSRTPFQLGEYAVKLRLVPITPGEKTPGTNGEHELRDDLAERLGTGPVRFRLQVQGYRDPEHTPLNDAREAWDSPWATVGELTLPRPGKGTGADAAVDKLSYGIGNRWSADDASLKGIGDINAIREAAYKASAEGRGVNPVNGRKCPFGFG